MNIKGIAFLVALAIAFMPAAIPKAEAQDTGSWSEQIHSLPGYIQSGISIIDECFGVFTQAENLDKLLQNIGVMATTFVSSLLDGVFNTIVITFVGFIAGIPFCIVGSLCTGLLFFVLGAIAYLIKAVVDGLGALTNPY